MTGVLQGVVKVRKLNNQDHLCVWFTTDREVMPSEIHDQMAKTLTAYMVPTAYLKLAITSPIHSKLNLESEFR
ncbi:MAG: hypothetical protein LBO69_06665 [Ignavibacteria bacterium]|nr:hypothetical protein [Ignavibacteria bacterium]